MSFLFLILISKRINYLYRILNDNKIFNRNIVLGNFQWKSSPRTLALLYTLSFTHFSSFLTPLSIRIRLSNDFSRDFLHFLIFSCIFISFLFASSRWFYLCRPDIVRFAIWNFPLDLNHDNKREWFRCRPIRKIRYDHVGFKSVGLRLCD